MRGERHILDIAELEIREGETLAIVGPNGAGKSTLLLVLAGLLRPDRGSIVVDGRPARPRAGPGLPAADRPGVPGAAAPVHLGLRQRRRGPALPRRGQAETRERVEHWLERLGILHLRDRPARSCPAARPSGPASRAPWCWTRTCCSWTSRSWPSTARPAPRSSTTSSGSARGPRDARDRDPPPPRGGPARATGWRSCSTVDPPVRHAGAGHGVAGRREVASIMAAEARVRGHIVASEDGLVVVDTGAGSGGTSRTVPDRCSTRVARTRPSKSYRRRARTVSHARSSCAATKSSENNGTNSSRPGRW